MFHRRATSCATLTTSLGTGSSHACDRLEATHRGARAASVCRRETRFICRRQSSSGRSTIIQDRVAMCARMSASYQVGGLTAVADVGDDGDLALEDLAARLRFATLQVVWRQWRALGAEGACRSVQGHRPCKLSSIRRRCCSSLWLSCPTSAASHSCCMTGARRTLPSSTFNGRGSWRRHIRPELVDTC
jgi:hypothetical protein